MLVGSNWGENGSVYIKGNGQYITSDMFKNLTKYDLQSKKICESFKKTGFFKENEAITIKLDMKNCIANIINESDKKSIDVSFPKKASMVIIVYMGGSAMKKLRIKSQMAY